jgi:MSHA biogenesis protein MshO
MTRNLQPRGFTLVEAVIVIAITGILSVAVAIFIQAPVQGYFDTARRAELTDIADTALRRLGRDLRQALPNSVRTGSSAGVVYLEFLQTSGGGRYRASADNAGGGNVLDFSQAISNVDVLGPAVATVAGEQNLLVVYNQGVPGADAYRGENTSAISAISGNTITFASKQFPFASPASRFQIISYPVTYACDAAAQTLTRYWNYPIAALQPTSFAVGTASALLAKNVSSCAFTYSANVISQRAGVVGTTLQISQSGESVNLYDEVHVSNVP